MTELKTLKDLAIQFDENNHAHIDFSRNLFTEETIKQEAIKWVKKLRTFRYRGDAGFIDDETGEFYSFPEWIEHFFNLTEEDLK